MAAGTSVHSAQQFFAPPDRTAALDRQFDELCRLVERGRLVKPPASMTRGADASKYVVRRRSTAAIARPENLARLHTHTRTSNLDLPVRQVIAPKVSMPQAYQLRRRPAAHGALPSTAAAESARACLTVSGSMPSEISMAAQTCLAAFSRLSTRIAIGVPQSGSLRFSLVTISISGPASRQVIDLLLDWQQDGESVFLKGNHETFLPRFLSDSRTLDELEPCGGLDTLLSYGLKPTINPDRNEQIRLADELALAIPESPPGFSAVAQAFLQLRRLLIRPCRR